MVDTVADGLFSSAVAVDALAARRHRGDGDTHRRTVVIDNANDFGRLPHQRSASAHPPFHGCCRGEVDVRRFLFLGALQTSVVGLLTDLVGDSVLTAVGTDVSTMVTSMLGGAIGDQVGPQVGAMVVSLLTNPVIGNGLLARRHRRQWFVQEPGCSRSAGRCGKRVGGRGDRR